MPSTLASFCTYLESNPTLAEAVRIACCSITRDEPPVSFMVGCKPFPLITTMSF